jgi:crotonobetainyl-CoA:carnitine CoA-transferase CaiB-like acyl-CoA transferase
MGNAHLNIAPYEVFHARDSWFTLGAANARQWEILCEVIDKPELKQDPRFVTNKDRIVNRITLVKILNEAFTNRDANDWLEKLQEAGIPSGPINSIQDVFNHPQAPERNFKMEIEHPTVGLVDLPGFPYKMSQTPPELHRPPPRLGEHTTEILTELLGYSTEQLTRLKKQKVI